MVNEISVHPPINYDEMFRGLLKRCKYLSDQRDEIDLEVAKLAQLITTIFPLINEQWQGMFQKEFAELQEQSNSLMEAVRLFFSKHREDWYSTSQVLDGLLDIGFDFRHYQSNPKASIATTMKRMVPTFLEAKEDDEGTGVTYRRKATLLDVFDESTSPNNGTELK